MTYALLLPFGIAFLELVVRLDMRREVTQIFGRSREALRVLASADIGDDEKEVVMRRESLALFKATGVFLGKFLVVALVLYLIYQLTVAMLPDRREELVASFSSPVDIVFLTVATLCYAWARNAVLKKL